MPFKTSTIEPEEFAHVRQSLQTKAEYLSIFLEDGIPAEIQYHEEALKQLREQRSSDEKTRQKIHTHQEELVKYTHQRKTLPEKINRLQSIDRSERCPCFFISPTTTSSELKQLMLSIKNQLGTTDPAELLFLDDIYERLESLANGLNMNEGLSIPLLKTEGKYSNQLITNYKLDRLILEEQDTPQVLLSASSFQLIKSMYTHVISGGTLTHLNKHEIAIVKNVQHNIEHLINQSHASNGTKLMGDLEKQTGTLIKSLSASSQTYSTEFKLFVNDLSKLIKIAPPFQQTESKHQAIDSFKQLRGRLKEIQTIRNEAVEVSPETRNPLRK